MSPCPNGTGSTSSLMVIKAAKKTLKRQESGSMKMKALTKSLLEKFESDDDVPSCKMTVRKWIEESDLFSVDGKNVTLKKSSKKRKSSDGDVEMAANKAAKKAKKDKKNQSTASTSTPSDNNSIQEWRKAHKIVLRDPRSGSEGAEATKKMVDNAVFYPYETFDAPGCAEKITASLIRQCTEVNGFTKPSPIQAQCWVSVFLRVAHILYTHLDSTICCVFNDHYSLSSLVMIQMGASAMLLGLQRLALVSK